jgi:16S rRNA (guanine527-N7)-methyltransferase
MDALVRRAAEAGLALRPSQMARIWAYFQLLAKWNEKINLTGLRVVADSPPAIDRLVVEPMLAALHARASRAMVDVGSGGGSPAIPFALALDPNPVLTMVESRERKSVFLREALRETGLSGDVYTGRFEDFAKLPSNRGAFELLTVRAVRLDAPILAAAEAVLAVGGQLFHLHQLGKSDESQSPLISWSPPVELIPGSNCSISIGNRLDVSRETH